MRRSDAQERPDADPEPARCLTLVEAAAYVALHVGQFERMVRAGVLPGPLPLGRRNRVWDRVALDAAIDGMSGLGRERRMPDRTGRQPSITTAIAERRQLRQIRKGKREDA